LQLRLIEQEARSQCRQFAGCQGEAQAQTGWPTPTGHALIEILKNDVI